MKLNEYEEWAKKILNNPLNDKIEKEILINTILGLDTVIEVNRHEEEKYLNYSVDIKTYPNNQIKTYIYYNKGTKLNLQELSDKLDKALDAETTQSLDEGINKKR